MNLRNQCANRPAEMPDEVQHAFLKILYYTLSSVRATAQPHSSFTTYAP